MRAAALGLVLALSPVAQAHDGVEAGVANARCYIEIRGDVYVDGPCDFASLDELGSFAVGEPGVGHGHPGTFAYLMIKGQAALGAWRSRNSAEEFLGMLNPADQCWKNHHATICVTK